MKATQAKLPDIPSRNWTCVQCGKETDKPYGFVQHGVKVTCKKACDIAYYREKPK